MGENDTDINVKGLEKLAKALKMKPPVARVGILGNSSARKEGSGPSNAEIGAAHEFGTSKLPMRSFLRIPISENLNAYLESSGLLDKKAMADVVTQGSLRPWVEKMAIVAEGIVIEGFHTGGFGRWAPWKTPGYENNTGMILVDTTQLRDSITSEVVDG